MAPLVGGFGKIGHCLLHARTTRWARHAAGGSGRWWRARVGLATEAGLEVGEVDLAVFDSGGEVEHASADHAQDRVSKAKADPGGDEREPEDCGELLSSLLGQLLWV